MTTTAVLFYLFRWIHFMAGITWIGMLYYFNFVQGPFMAETDAVAKPHVISKLLPRALWWFRWGAMWTFLSGLGLLGLGFHNLRDTFYDTWFGWGITYGALLAITMFLNVWLVIWPKQQIVMKSNAQVMGGGTALPEAAPSARRAFLASRTNTLLSIPMLAFMAAPRWLALKNPDSTQKIIALVFTIAVVGLAEFNALTGDKGPLTKPLDTVKSTWTSALVLAFVSLGFFIGVFGLP